MIDCGHFDQNIRTILFSMAFFVNLLIYEKTVVFNGFLNTRSWIFCYRNKSYFTGFPNCLNKYIFSEHFWQKKFQLKFFQNITWFSRFANMNILASKIHSKMHYVEKNIFFERLIFFSGNTNLIFHFKNLT